ncbi:MAG TPA: S-layer homology domain-containing protein [Candidatus Galloscillospira excrementipullorum]|nr:S-layer homology domain-containing protein [Candidatus Galloscillospira excrementipullorum]
MEKRKRYAGVLAALILTGWICLSSALPAAAGREPGKYLLELLADGKEAVQLSTEETLELTVTLRLPQEQESAVIYAMQDELVFDGTALELVQGSIEAAQGFDVSLSRLGDGVSWRMIVSRMETNEQGLPVEDGMQLVRFKVCALKAGDTAAKSQNAKIHDAAGNELPVLANEVSVSVKSAAPPQEGEDGGGGGSGGGGGGGAGGGGGGGGGAGGGGGGGAGPQDPAPQEPGKTDETNPQETPETPAFDDVAQDAWYYGAVSRCAREGLMTGTAQNLFSPDLPMSRAMLVTALYRLEGEPQRGLESLPFEDVDPQAWYFRPVLWGVEQDIVRGVEQHLFQPDENVTREQLAVILFRLSKAQPQTHQDGAAGLFEDWQEVSEWAREGMSWALEEGIVTGRGEGVLAPGDSASRAEVAAMLCRFLDAVDTKEE